MLIKILLFCTSIIFILVKYLYVNIFSKSKFQTYPGYFLLKLKIDFLKYYLSQFKCPVIFITGTNGKTSTTHLLNHLLESVNYKVLSNKSGSNLKRGILTSLVLQYLHFFFKKPDFLVFELDEGSVYDVFKSIPSSLEKRYLILLNLSRDQLDRYGEIDLIQNKIKKSCNDYSVTLIGFNKDCLSGVPNSFLVTKLNNTQLVKNLKIENEPHLISNLDFIQTLFTILNIKIDTAIMSPFSLVKGRGSSILLFGNNYFINLCKNPVSFNNSLNIIKNKNINTILVVLNDNIPDGRDVSWFYDIDFTLIKKIFKNKTVFVAGSRGFDFYNLLKIAGISSFNALTFNNYVLYANKYSIKETFVLSNYSATQNIIKYAENV